MNITFDEVVIAIGQEEAQQLRRISLAVYERADEIARQQGLILADTKFEMGLGARASTQGTTCSQTRYSPRIRRDFGQLINGSRVMRSRLSTSSSFAIG